MKTFFKIALLSVVALSLASCGQKVIEGKVTDEEGNAIADAVVRIDNSQFEARTGMKGEYRLDYIPGEVRLVTSKEGYETQEVVLSVPEKRHYAAPPTQLRREDNPIQQKQTISDIRNLGTAMFSWLTDQIGAAAAGQQMNYVDIGQGYVPISHAQLSELLVPQYIRSVPERDGWGHKLDVYLNVEKPLARKVMAIRSPGRDGKFSPGLYSTSEFSPGDYDQDIVWADGFFVRWPEKDR
jgi:hypothetical protein